MAFLYPDKNPEVLTDLEIIQDVLLTQNKIESDLRSVLARLDGENYSDKAIDGDKVLDYYPVTFNGGRLFDAFGEACTKHAIHQYIPNNIKSIDSDLKFAWTKYEHFQFPPLSEIISNDNSEYVSKRLREKYADYNRYVMPYCDLFQKPNEEIAKILFGNLKKKLSKPVPLTDEGYSKLKLNDIAAFTQAAYGAMGEPGVMYIVTKYMDVYGIYIDAYEKMGNKYGLATIFNSHETPSLKLMHDGEMNTAEWYQFYTGFGNVLYIKHHYLPKAKEYILKTLGEKWDCVGLYRKRFDLIEYAILNTTRKKSGKRASKSLEDNAYFNIREHAPIELTIDNIDEINYDDILAIQYGTGRAQGETYGVLIAMKDLRVYHINVGFYIQKYHGAQITFLNPNIPEKVFYKKFPLIEQTIKYGSGSDKIEEGWNRIYMSIGFYLFVRDEISEKFLENVDKHEGRMRLGWLYGYWFDMLKESLGIKINHSCEGSDIHDIISWTINKKINGAKLRDTFEKIDLIDEDKKRRIYQLSGKSDKPRYIVYDKKKDVPLYFETLSDLKRYM